MKRRAALPWFVLLLVAGCIYKTEPDFRGQQQLVIVATTDFHSNLDRAERLASVIRSLRQEHGDRILFLDAGDQFQGSLEARLSKGEATVEFFNAIGLDAAAIGNHDLDYGPQDATRVHVLPGEDGLANLKIRVQQAKYQWLSANIVQYPYESCTPGAKCNALGKRTPFEPRAVIDRAGYRIGLIGATTTTTPQITNPDFVRDIKFEELPELVQAEAQYLRGTKKCDLVLLVVHEGLKPNRSGGYMESMGLLPVIRQLPKGTLNAVVAGHTHIRAQEEIHGTPVIQAGLYGQVAGVLTLKGSPERLSHHFQSWIEIPKIAEQPDITALLAPYREAAENKKRVPVGSAGAEFPVEYGNESALGNLVADAILEEGIRQDNADFALMNAGGLRNPLHEGPITYGDVYKVHPFENSLSIADLTGAQLQTVLEIAFSGALGMPSVSGLQIQRLNVPPDTKGPWDRDLNGDGIQETWERDLLVEVQDSRGKPIQDHQHYKLATIDYLTDGGDYQGFVFQQINADRIRILLEFPVREVLTRFLQENSIVFPQNFISRKRVELLAPAAAVTP